MAKPPSPLLPVRSAVVLLLSLPVGVAAGLLSYCANGGMAVAVLIGGSAAGGALALFDKLLGS